MNSITSTDFNFENQKYVYKGKVRDVYTIGEDLLVMIVTDRLSAFDVILPKGIPYKGQILNQIACESLKQTSSIVPNWLMDTPDVLLITMPSVISMMPRLMPYSSSPIPTNWMNRKKSTMLWM